MCRRAAGNPSLCLSKTAGCQHPPIFIFSLFIHQTLIGCLPCEHCAQCWEMPENKLLPGLSHLVSSLPLLLNPATLALLHHKPSKIFPPLGPLHLQFPIPGIFCFSLFKWFSLYIISSARASLTTPSK